MLKSRFNEEQIIAILRESEAVAEKRRIVEETLAEGASVARVEIEHLKLLIAKLRRMQFGRRPEKVQRQIDRFTVGLAGSLFRFQVFEPQLQLPRRFRRYNFRRYCQITVGVLRPASCVATACDEDCTYAMLVRAKPCFSC